MRKVRVLYRPDGGVSLGFAAPKSRRINEPEDEWLLRVFDRMTPEGWEYDDMDESELPEDWSTQSAWEGSKSTGIVVKKSKVDKVKKESKEKDMVWDEMFELARESLRVKGEIT